MNLLKYLTNKIRVGKNNKLIMSKTCKLRDTTIRISGKNNIVELRNHTNFREVEIEVAGNDCHLIIDENTIIGKNTYISLKEKNVKLIIGKNTMISRNAKIMTSDGHDILCNGKRINFAKDIIIGDGVWIADNVTILKGVTIGNESILGMNSTITRDVPNNVIVVGNPAKIIKENISWTKELTY